jgi:hypothetical protein
MPKATRHSGGTVWPNTAIGHPRPVSAPVLREIQEWDAAGVSHLIIARRLNDRGEPLPTKWLYAGGAGGHVETAVPVQSGDPGKWHPAAIQQVLDDAE